MPGESKYRVKFTKRDCAKEPQSIGAAVGYDLFATADTTLEQNEVKVLDTGISVELPENVEAQVRGKSGLACRGIMVVNSPGTIDPDYRGYIGVILTKVTPGTYYIKRGDKIAQLVFNEIVRPILIEVEEEDMTKTERGKGGFGSTGR